MRTLLAALLLLFSFTSCPASEAWSLPPVDLEASGDDLEMEGSGSGGGSTEVTKPTPLNRSKDGTDSTNTYRSATENVLKEYKVNPWDREPTIIQKSRSFMESKEVLAGVIAGGVGGLVLAVLLGGLLIYKWQKKDTSGYVPGQTQERYLADPIGALRGEDVVLV